jgi:RNA polymerase sigma factor (sigma-70 family)
MVPERPERIDAIATRWSLIHSAHLAGQPHSVAEARQLLVLRYAPAIRRYVGAMVHDVHDSDEIAQDIVVRLLRGDFAGADPDRGRFRDLLITSIRNMVRTFWSRRQRAQTQPLVPDAHSGDDSANDQWLSAWRQSVLDQTWQRLLAAPDSSSRLAARALRLRTEHPGLNSPELAERLAAEHGQPVTADYYRQLLHRGRQRFVEHLLDEIRASLPVESDAAVEEELAALGLLEQVRSYLADRC